MERLEREGDKKIEMERVEREREQAKVLLPERELQTFFESSDAALHEKSIFP
jgi:hypothetical protein